MLAIALAAVGLAASLGYTTLAVVALVIVVGVFFPYKIDRESFERNEQIRRLNAAIGALRVEAARPKSELIKVAVLNDIDRIAGDVAALTTQIEIHRKRSLEMQQRYGQLETSVSRSKLGDP